MAKDISAKLVGVERDPETEADILTVSDESHTIFGLRDSFASNDQLVRDGVEYYYIERDEEAYLVPCELADHPIVAEFMKDTAVTD